MFTIDQTLNIYEKNDSFFFVFFYINSSQFFISEPEIVYF